MVIKLISLKYVALFTHQAATAVAYCYYVAILAEKEILFRLHNSAVIIGNYYTVIAKLW